MASSFFLVGCTSQYTGYGNWANDIVGDTDENFTNGFEIGVQIPKNNMNETTIAVMGLLPAFRISADDPKEITHGRIGLSQEMYTPSNLRTPDVIENENPYGGVTSFLLTRTNADETRRISTTLETGVSGDWSGAEDLQKFVHTDLGFGTDPKGWHNQIGSEPVVNLNHERLYENLRKKIWKLQFVSQTGAIVRLGNKHTDAIALQTFKLGLNPPTLDGSNKDFAIYLFTSPFMKGVVHNIFYDGAVFADNVHTVNSKPFVFGLDSGIAVEYDNYSIKFHYNIRSKDYYEQEGFTHTYGLLTFGFKW